MSNFNNMSHHRRWLAIMTYGLANGIIYLLPYVQYTHYDSMRDALQLNNTQLGTLISVFGLINAVLYPVGGLFLDKYAKDKFFIVSALIITGAGGLYLANHLDYTRSLLIMSLWAFTISFLFWTAFINGRRRLGTEADMGRVFGLSESFSMLCALFSSATGLIVFQHYNESFRSIIIYYSLLHFVAAIICLIFLPADPKGGDSSKKPAGSHTNMLEGLRILIKRKDIWYICGIVFCSYGIGMTIGKLNPYLTGVFGLSIVLTATISIINQYAIPIIGPFSGGMIADKMKCSTRFIKHCFIWLAVGSTALIFIPGKASFVIMMVIFGLSIKLVQTCQRGAYWVPLTDTRIPEKYSGTAIGLVSFLGFLPEAFLQTLWGKVLDIYADNQIIGYKIIWGGILAMSVIGFILCLLLIRDFKQRGVLDTQGHIIPWTDPDAKKI